MVGLEHDDADGDSGDEEENIRLTIRLPVHFINILAQIWNFVRKEKLLLQMLDIINLVDSSFG